MRFLSITIAFVALNLIHITPVLAIDTRAEERTCSEIGFKKKTEAHANCVLELLERKSESTAPEPVYQQQYSAPTDPDDATCQKYGLRPGTQPYGQCRMQIDMTKREMATQQQEYAERKRQFDEELAEVKRKRRQAVGMQQLQMGLGMMGLGPNANSGSYSRPMAPNPMAPQSRVLRMPNGAIINCTTDGTFTNCN